ncbi:MAG: nicotinate-nucleotide adenylyltransferase [Hyphomonadaceae bacterium]|nr:nicotinate-nucleotide adenylyltransferase [Hyphomonadaceae bacterium]
MTIAHLPGPTRGLRIGLFGGSFNPAHEGHLHVAETALHRLQLDAVWWLVAGGNPLKETHGVFEARLASARRLARGPNMRVTSLERTLGVRYTADLLEKLLPRARGARFVWIMGADNLGHFHRWGRWDEIACRMPIAVVGRPGASPKAGLSKFARRFAAARLPEHAAPALPFADAPAWTYLTAPWHTASSTALRRRAAARNPFRRKSR